MTAAGVLAPYIAARVLILYQVFDNCLFQLISNEICCHIYDSLPKGDGCIKVIHKKMSAPASTCVYGAGNSDTAKAVDGEVSETRKIILLTWG